MKTKPIFLLFFLSFITLSYSAPGQGNGFSGEWKLNKEKTVLADNQLFLSGLTINLKSDSLLTTRVYENANGDQYPFEENLSLDGKECKITIYDMPRTTKVSKSSADGSLTVESITEFNGNNGIENLTSKESWKIDPDGKTLVIGFTNKMAGTESTGTNYYTRVK
jgi:hypothetical protein